MRHVRQFWHGMRIRVSSFDLSWARAFEVTDAIPHIILKLPLQEKVTEMQKMVQTRLWTQDNMIYRYLQELPAYAVLPYTAVIKLPTLAYTGSNTCYD